MAAIEMKDCTWDYDPKMVYVPPTTTWPSPGTSAPAYSITSNDIELAALRKEVDELKGIILELIEIVDRNGR